MLPFDRQWFSQSAASDHALANLEQAVGVPLPAEYLALLSFSNGGEGPLPVEPYNFCLDSVEITTEAWSGGSYREFFPGFLVFGGNGGGEYIAFDLRSSIQPWPVVALNMTNTDLSESVTPIANDFASFLKLVGVASPDA
jgi:hypothetical protein